MFHHIVCKMPSVRAFLLLGVCIAMLNAPCAQAQSQTTASTAPTASPTTTVTPATVAPLEFEAATIKPVKESNPNQMRDRTDVRRFTTRYTTLRDLLQMAYGMERQQVVGGPTWIATDEYDIDAVASDPDQMAHHREEMLQKLLADRFKLTTHREQRELPIYALVVAKGGPKLKTADPNEPQGSSCERLGQCTFKRDALPHFARWLNFVVLNKPVEDKTGLTGEFDFTLKWTPDESQFGGMGFHVPPPADGASALPELFTAIQEQLGLKLEPQKISAEVLVIDHVERPSEN
jgi:uncharacterized protein (TIGR03435 family)